LTLEHSIPTPSLLSFQWACKASQPLLEIDNRERDTCTLKEKNSISIEKNRKKRNKRDQTHTRITLNPSHLYQISLWISYRDCRETLKKTWNTFIQTLIFTLSFIVFLILFSSLIFIFVAKLLGQEHVFSLPENTVFGTSDISYFTFYTPRFIPGTMCMRWPIFDEDILTIIGYMVR